MPPKAMPPPPMPTQQVDREALRAEILAQATAGLEEWVKVEANTVVNLTPKALPQKRTEAEIQEAKTAKRQRQKLAKAQAKGVVAPGSSGAVAEKAKDVAVPGSSAAASSGTGLSAAAEKASSSGAASSGPVLVSYTGVPLPKQQGAPPASALEKIRAAMEVQ